LGSSLTDRLAQAEHKRELAACQARRGGADFTRLVVALRGSVECLSSVAVETGLHPTVTLQHRATTLEFLYQVSDHIQYLFL
jgi:hypothetical protein